jgi:hypothetical protein
MAINYRGEKFSGYNKPKRTPGKNKKFAVLAKQGNQVRLIRYGDPNMSIKKDQPKRRKSLKNPVFKNMLEELNNSLVKQWSIAETTEEREFCWFKVNALSSVVEDLQAFVHNNKIENGE